MKMLVMNRKIVLSLLMLVLICGLYGVSDARVCQVGDIIQPGESCTYPGTNDVFSVDAAGNARLKVGFVFFSSGGNLNIRNSNINGRRYTLVTEHSAGGGRRITELAGTTAPPPISLGTVPTVKVSPASVVSPAVGEQLEVSINITDGEAVAGYEVAVEFDTTALRYVSSVHGDYLPAGAFLLDPVVAGNLVKLGAASVTGESNGDGTLARFTFEVIAVKASTVKLSEVTLANSAAESIPLRVEDGQVTVPAVNTHIPAKQAKEVEVSFEEVEPESLVISSGNNQEGTPNVELTNPLVVQVLDANDNGVANNRVIFRVKTGQGKLSDRGNGRAVAVQTDSRGYARADFTPLRAGTITVEAKAAGVRAAGSFIINVNGATGDTGDPMPGTTAPREYKLRDKIPVSLSDTLSFTGSRTLSGTTYTCVGPGECVVSYGLVVKGQIQASPAKTTAPREYKLKDKIPVSLSDTLSFTGSRTLSGTTYTCVGPGECVVSYGLVVKGQIRVAAAPATTPRTTEITAEVLLNAANRSSLYWVDNGAIYPLIGGENGESLELSPVFSVSGVNAIATSGNAIYWTEQTGENTGTINTANFFADGSLSDTKELVSIKAVPRGIAVDPVAKRLYWTNSQGWIQSSNLEGKARRNIVSGGLEDPMGIAVGNGSVFWTEGSGGAWYTDIRGEDSPTQFSSTVTAAATDVAVFEDKVYWTEQTGKNSGTIYSAYLVSREVSEPKQLVSIKAVPKGIAVDPVAKRLYWTNSQGWIQSSNLEGKARRNVAKGLGNPGSIALSTGVFATTPITKSPTPDANKYDVNGDGTVDAKDSDAMIVAVTAGITDTKYDVNGDGKVDVKDVVAVAANRSASAAAAPTLLGRKFSALEVDRLQEQIDLLIATNDRSPAAMQTLIYLQQLIVMARPEKTQLLANYPNPFNPETWIPYQLAKSADVTLRIYAVDGQRVRTLDLGHQPAGVYRIRSRAAYWDGRNAVGEPVASGVYFYTLTAGDFTATRKMLIRK